MSDDTDNDLAIKDDLAGLSGNTCSQLLPTDWPMKK